MGGIVRQSDQYAAFDNTPRPERTYEAPPAEIIAEYTRGPSIGVGHLSPEVRRHFAVNTEGMDPASHAYGGGAGDPLFGEFGHDGYDYEGVSRGEFNHRMRGRDPDEESQMAREDIHDQDDDSGYNWGPEPDIDLNAEPGADPDFHGDAPHPFGTPIYNPRSSPYDDITGSYDNLA